MGNLDLTSLYKIGYGLYVVTSNDGERDNGLIVNSVIQISNKPLQLLVCIDKKNYSHDVIKNTGKMNVNCITVSAPFAIFENFGFKSGRDFNKFAEISAFKSENGLNVLEKNVNSFLSLKVESYLDFGSHGGFICSVTEAKVLTDEDSMSYAYYHKYVKPKPKKTLTGYTCKICGYFYEGEPLPDDFICPICKHPASDFEKI